MRRSLSTVCIEAEGTSAPTRSRRVREPPAARPIRTAEALCLCAAEPCRYYTIKALCRIASTEFRQNGNTITLPLDIPLGVVLQTYQVGDRDNGVKVTIATNDRGKFALIYKSRANRQSSLVAKSSDLLSHFGLY